MLWLIETLSALVIQLWMNELDWELKDTADSFLIEMTIASTWVSFINCASLWRLKAFALMCEYIEYDHVKWLQSNRLQFSYAKSARMLSTFLRLLLPISPHPEKELRRIIFFWNVRLIHSLSLFVFAVLSFDV